MSAPGTVRVEPAAVRAPDALRVEGMVKSFGGVRALRGVDLAVRPGEVHALLGQNGCGKSTLVKILTGVHAPDEGRAEFFGEPLALPVSDPAGSGIAVVHQDIGLADSMTVLENLGATGGYGTRLLAPVQTSRQRARFGRLMDRIGFAVPLDALVSELAPAERAMVGILRAMDRLSLDEASAGRHVFILDEPTAALGREDSVRLLELMRTVARTGAAVVFISHRLNEVMAACDRLTVLRDGATVLTAEVASVDRHAIIAAMLGRELEEFFPSPPDDDAREVRLRLEGVRGEVLRDLTLTVRSREIVGVTGLAGMGQDELPQMLAGAHRVLAGAVEVDGAPVVFRDPADAIRSGIAVVPGNRLRDGCWVAASAQENVTLPVIRSLSGRLGIRGGAERRTARAALERSGLNPLEPERPMSSFSGGNQQKVVFAKWLQLRPGVLVLHEPTQGVDAGAAKELLEQVVQHATEGAAVLIVSGDHEQLVEVCHRVLVIGDGTVLADIPRAALTEQALLAASSLPMP
ncbi:sugar ABC transporter ATP-binding protein [Herbiconiux sp.]|uniref:sugar ABC transporter ATP-binding protein n=1 Tax=Herbiconiux sp. TaxID=1871186 RepID=UPI0025BACF53|nr:sugar ABC transporter ATP-binding protein [Herbiconiux sp.]